MATFKTWQTWVVNFFDQDPIYEQFLPGGRYETWIAASVAPRGFKGSEASKCVTVVKLGEQRPQSV